jgi:hypothetical protein
MKVSVPVINTVINAYGLFEIIEDEDGSLFISTQLNKWLEPYYNKVESLSRAGKISAAKRKKKQEEQLKQLEMNLSEDNSSQHMLNTSATINKLINKRNKEKNLSNKSDEKKERDNFANFKKELEGKEIRFTLPYPFSNFMQNTVIRLKKTGYLHNELISKDLSAEQAHSVWEYMFAKREELLKIVNGN